MSKVILSKPDVEAIVVAQLEKEILEISKVHVEKCIENIRTDISDKLAAIAVRMAKEYSIRNIGEHIIIEIRNRAEL